MFSRYLPSFGHRNIKIYYLLAVLVNGWFVLSNWVFLYSKYITRTEIGIVEGVAILTGILMEVPSGVFSDLLGKKKTIIIGSLFTLLSCIVIVFATDFWGFLIGNVLTFIGFSFHSGTIEAFAYDSLKEKKKEKHYSVVVSRYTSLSIITTVISTFIGGWLFSIGATVPFMAWGVFLFFSIILMMFSREPAVDTYIFNVANYVKHLKEGVRGIFSKSLSNYLIPILALSMLIKSYQGLVRQSTAAYFSFNGETFGYLLGIISIPAVLISYKFHIIKKLFREKTLLLINLLVYLGVFGTAMIFNNIWLGGFLFLILNVNENVTKPLISVIINERIDSKHRTTILSTLALIGQIPYVIIVLSFAYLTELFRLPVLYGAFTFFLIIIFLYTTFKTKNESFIYTPKLSAK